MGADHGQAAGCGTDTLPASPCLYLPLKATDADARRLAIAPRQEARLLNPGTTAPARYLRRPDRASRWNGCITSRSRRKPWSGWNRNACAMACLSSPLARSAHPADGTGRPGRFHGADRAETAAAAPGIRRRHPRTRRCAPTPWSTTCSTWRACRPARSRSSANGNPWKMPSGSACKPAPLSSAAIPCASTCRATCPRWSSMRS